MTRTLWVPLLAALLASSSASAQRLRQVSRTVREGRSTPRASNDNNPDGGSRSRRASQSPRAPGRWNLRRRYLTMPYQFGIAGFEFPEGSEAVTRGSASVLTLEGGLVLPNLGRMGLSVRAIFGAIEVELRGAALVEPLSEGTQWAGLVGVRGAYAITDGGPARLRAIAGFISFLDGEGDASGVELGFGLDAFPRKPLVLSLEVTGGILGRAGVLNARASIGLLVDRTEVFLGWSHMVLFPMVEGPTVDLGGPLLGLRFWL